jgi:hypothetical protein
MAGINDKRVTVTTDYVANGKDTGIANTSNANNTPGIVQKYAQGGPVHYLASGGGDWAASGTDTVRAMLTPGEYVMPVASSKSIGKPALDYMRATGNIPGGGGTVTVNLVLDGQVIDSRIVNLSNAAMGSAVRDAKYRRPGV